MLTLGVLCSGGLGINTLEKLSRDYNIKFVLTDNGSEQIIAFAKKEKIPFFAGNPRDGKAFNFIKNIVVDVIASINYLFLIENDIINHSKKLTFNIHGSLLPKYRGRTPHVWAIIKGETKAGITAHVIDSGCDTGKIIHQIGIDIDYEDTGADMLKKYSKAYYPLVQKVLKAIIDNKIELKNQNEDEATYFGKRTPDDGEINWNSNVDAIRNWVRAQAKPYPGAFTFYDNKKIIIDKVLPMQIDFKKIENSSNGEIIEILPKVLVKCADGVLALETIRTENCTFTKGKKFENENRK